ncbi:heat shock protein HspQ [Legionella impletisoli]|uniref:Heat shock protein HspQ n=1 Tax=Legionella impletisoli TaxID=343510 RepID=A0A917JVV1_9GAMM|nr:heat shock protein HspQ [Legionella impletisoli]GGI84895.1 DNA-binding protein [Legionella impletisoli]
MDKQARYNIGDVVIHKRQGYRAVVIDVDPLFQASGRYNPQAIKRGFEERDPWYRLLVDESTQMTYVEERLLLPDESECVINNPNVEDYLVISKGHYQSNIKKH